jgi:hypothetical protein
MNLLCPNCQKMLTVPEQFAGQLMKCPLCNGTFTVPSLPAAAPPPPPPEVFGVKDNEPAALPSASLTPPSTTATTTAPSAPPPPPPPPLPPGEYTHKSSIWFSPKVIQFIPAAALVLVFFLQLTPWVGFYLGSYAVVSQNAWGAAFASKSPEENDLKGLFRWTTEKAVKDGEEPRVPVVAYPPSWSPLTVLYLLLYFLTAALTLACVVLPFVAVKLPPAVKPFLRWKWAVAFLFNLVLFVLLLLQLALGFGLETSVKNAESDRQAVLAKTHDKESPLPQKQMDAVVSDAVSHVQITYFLELVVLLHLLTVICALLLFWLNQRETFNKPLPELSLRW